MRRSFRRIRPIKRLIKSKPAIEGAGVHLRRAFGFGNTTEFDPFLLLDDFRNEVPEDYLAGFPWHPHRGIEMSFFLDTYIFVKTLKTMVFGRERHRPVRPAPAPKPRYQEVKTGDIPEITDDDGTHVRLVCGTFWGKKGPVDGIATETSI